MMPKIDIVETQYSRYECLTVSSSSHLRPLRAIHVLSQIIHDADMPAFHQMQMSQNLSVLEDVVGGCERILKAPIPVPYTRCGRVDVDKRQSETIDTHLLYVFYTPECFPLVHRHTARFLFFWLTLLPFSLYATCGVYTTAVVAGIAAVLCGIEEIGVQVEEPFG